MSEEISQWMPYEQAVAEAKWMEERERLFFQMVADGIAPWDFHKYIKEYEQKDSPDRQR